MSRLPTRSPRGFVAIAAVLFAVALLGWESGVGNGFVVLATALGTLALVGAARSAGVDTSERKETGSEGSEDEGAVWDAIPPRQYGGRHVESGGLTRDEQEQALSEIQQQAEELQRER